MARIEGKYPGSRWRAGNVMLRLLRLLLRTTHSSMPLVNRSCGHSSQRLAGRIGSSPLRPASGASHESEMLRRSRRPPWST